MILLLSLNLFCLSVINFFNCKKKFITMLLCILLWFFVQYFAIIPLDPKYICILFIICFVPPFLSSLKFNKLLYNFIPKFFRLLMYCIILMILVASSMIMSYYQIYGRFGETQLLGVLQTNISESLEGAKLFVGLRFFVYFILFSLFVHVHYFISNYLNKISYFNTKFNFLIKYKVLFLFISFFGVLGVCSYQDFDQKNMMIRLVKSYFKTYKKSFEIVEQRKNMIIPDYKMRTVADDKTIILVVGESATKNHMGAYGYFRDTTPWLSQQVENGRAVLFKNAFSSHALTALTVPLIISESRQKFFDDIPTSPSVINIFNKMDYNTYWFSNQGQLQGALYLFPLLNEANFKYFSSVQYLNRSENYDSELIDHIKNNVDFSKSNFIVIHLMGSHFQYKYRYPKDFSPNLQSIKAGFYGVIEDDKVNKIDSYDKSISYTDSFFQKLASIFDDNSSVVILYLSDHGESVVGNYQHDYSKEMNTDIFSIPFFIWTSSKFEQKYKKALDILRTYTDKYFTNDRANEIIKYLAGIDVDIENIFVSKYEDVEILHGQKKLTDLTNGVIKSNIDKIRSSFETMCICGNTKTLKKVMIAEECGFDGVEIDLLYDENLNVLFVADMQKNSKLPLNVFLNQMKHWSYKRLVLRVNNITNESKYKILSILNQLDDDFNIIDRTLLVFPDSQNKLILDKWKTIKNFKNLNSFEISNFFYILNYDQLDLINNNNDIFNDKLVLVLDDKNIQECLVKSNQKYFFDSIIYNVISDGEL